MIFFGAPTYAPSKGEVVIFNRSYYENVLVVRVLKLVERSVWSKRYDLINDFETMLTRHKQRLCPSPLSEPKNVLSFRSKSPVHRKSFVQEILRFS